MRREFFQPHLVVVMKTRLVVVNEHRSSDVHGVDQTKAFHYAAPVNEFLDLRRDVDEPASIRYFEPKMFSERFHSSFLQIKCQSQSDILIVSAA
jgi:hypothetical protein